MLTQDQVLAGIDRAAVKRLLRGTYMEKYGNLRAAADDALRWATAFGLHRCQSRRVLDIGCGIGMFCRVANLLGHRATGLDQPGYMHAEVCELLGVQYVEHGVTAADPLPDFCAESFDLVSMMHVSNHEGAARYAALARAAWRVLVPGGRFWVVFHIAGQHWADPLRWLPWWPGRVAKRGTRVILLEKP